MQELDMYLKEQIKNFAGDWSYLIQRYDDEKLPKISYQKIMYTNLPA